jgi:uncharacterized phage-associated protein
MEMQKLVYFAHGWMLGVYERPLISQRVEAWDYGPVISDLYHAFKHFGNLPITQPAKSAQMTGRAFHVTQPEFPKHQDPQVASLLDRVWATYKHFTAIQLSNMTHAPDSPWSTARKNNQPFIDDDLIKKYFRCLTKMIGSELPPQDKLDRGLAACVTSVRAPLTNVRGSVESARYRTARVSERL